MQLRNVYDSLLNNASVKDSETILNKKKNLLRKYDTYNDDFLRPCVYTLHVAFKKFSDLRFLDQFDLCGVWWARDSFHGKSLELQQNADPGSSAVWGKTYNHTVRIWVSFQLYHRPIQSGHGFTFVFSSREFAFWYFSSSSRSLIRITKEWQ